jgi:hypothetical protein
MELRERRVGAEHLSERQRPALCDRPPTARHPGYGASQRVRKRIEEVFGWIKTIAGQSRTKLRGRARYAGRSRSRRPHTTSSAWRSCRPGAARNDGPAFGEALVAAGASPAGSRTTSRSPHRRG